MGELGPFSYIRDWQVEQGFRGGTLIFPPRGLHVVGTGTPDMLDTNRPEKVKRKPSPVRAAGLHVSSRMLIFLVST
jgi:hypothetical protein